MSVANSRTSSSRVCSSSKRLAHSPPHPNLVPEARMLLLGELVYLVKVIAGYFWPLSIFSKHLIARADKVSVVILWPGVGKSVEDLICEEAGL